MSVHIFAYDCRCTHSFVICIFAIIVILMIIIITTFLLIRNHIIFIAVCLCVCVFDIICKCPSSHFPDYQHGRHPMTQQRRFSAGRAAAGRRAMAWGTQRVAGAPPPCTRLGDGWGMRHWWCHILLPHQIPWPPKQFWLVPLIPILVVWNMDCIFPFSWECHHPNWRTHIFQRGWFTTNQLKNWTDWIGGKSTRNHGPYHQSKRTYKPSQWIEIRCTVEAMLKTGVAGVTHQLLGISM